MKRGLLPQLPLALAIVAFVVVGSPALAGAGTHGQVPATAPRVSLGPTRGVDGTLADTGESRTSRADRHTPRQPELGLVVPLAALLTALLLVGHLARRQFGEAHLRLRDCIGRRAPPAVAAS